MERQKWFRCNHKRGAARRHCHPRLEAGDEGKLATDIIHNLLEEDKTAGGRLRMIVVYTADPDLEDIREAVRTAMSDVLPNLEVIDRPDKARALKAPHMRLLFINKGATSGSAEKIDESDLPRTADR